MSGCTPTGRPVIQILLSTYNGEKYLREQLDSFLAQKNFAQCSVLIRDDGSTDGTREILREYERLEQFTVWYGENCGVTGSYWWLLEHSDSECEYFAFSDQDDVWLPDKLSAAQRMIERVSSKERPILFASRSQIVDETLKQIGSSILPVRGTSFYNAMVQNVCPGHTQVFNRPMQKLLRRGDISQAHVVDWWTYLLASGVGEVVFSEEFTVLHRQHAGNAVGYQMNFLKQFCRRLKRMHSNEAAQITRQLVGFASSYKQLLPEEYRAELERFLACQDHFFSRLHYAFTGKCRRQTPVETLLVRGLYAAGKYRLRD